jgi:hypothetical protein
VTAAGTTTAFSSGGSSEVNPKSGSSGGRARGILDLTWMKANQIV